jgi:hypothetical protein
VAVRPRQVLPWPRTHPALLVMISLASSISSSSSIYYFC